MGMMPGEISEHVAVFGENASLVGIVTEPVEAARGGRSPAVVLLNAGVTHRVGPGRLYVKLARCLALAGFPVLRLDFSGVGDSPSRADALPVAESRRAEVTDAIDWITNHSAAESVILAGMCSGAVASFNGAVEDDRVAGAVLINAQHFVAEAGPGYESICQRRRNWRYFRDTALFSARSWYKLIGGRADYKSLAVSVAQVVTSRRLRRRRLGKVGHSLQSRFDIVDQKRKRLLILYAKTDPGLQELADLGDLRMGKLRSYPSVDLVVSDRWDHLISTVGEQERVIAYIRDWVARVAAERIGRDRSLPRSRLVRSSS